MSCTNCGVNFSERSQSKHFEFTDVLTCNGAEQIVNFKSRAAEVKQAWAIDPRAELAWNKHSVTFSGPLGARIAVQFLIAG